MFPPCPWAWRWVAKVEPLSRPTPNRFEQRECRSARIASTESMQIVDTTAISGRRCSTHAFTSFRSKGIFKRKTGRSLCRLDPGAADVGPEEAFESLRVRGPALSCGDRLSQFTSCSTLRRPFE